MLVEITNHFVVINDFLDRVELTIQKFKFYYMAQMNDQTQNYVTYWTTTSSRDYQTIQHCIQVTYVEKKNMIEHKSSWSNKIIKTYD